MLLAHGSWCIPDMSLQLHMIQKYPSNSLSLIHRVDGRHMVDARISHNQIHATQLKNLSYLVKESWSFCVIDFVCPAA